MHAAVTILWEREGGLYDNGHKRPEHLEQPEQEAFRLLVRTASRLEAELNRIFRPYELTGATFNILRILQAAGAEGRSCGDIAEQLIAEVPDMTRLLDRLERLGYVRRERSRVDRRMVKVVVTEKGLSAVQSLDLPVRECHHRQFAELVPEKLENLTQLLNVIKTKRVSEGEEAASERRDVEGAQHSEQPPRM